MDRKENIRFTDFVDLEIIQQFQDSFSDATGVASLITDPDGIPITKPSNFCGLCQMIRETEKGLINCYKSDAYIGKQQKGGLIYSKCLSGGLLDAGANISVDGKHVANWLVGQVIIDDDEVNESKILQYAREIGIDNETRFRNELNDVPRMSRVKFGKIVKALFIYANELSEKAYQNLQLKLHQEHLKELVAKKTEKLKEVNDKLLEKNETILVQNSELKDALRQLKETKVQLIEVDKMASLGILTAGVAHEINNPLNYLMGAYVGLEEYFKEYGSQKEEDTSLFLNCMKTGIDRATNIVQGLNQFSRDGNNFEEDCDIHKVLDNCLLMVFSKSQHCVQIKKEYFKEPIVIKGNVGKLHQVFINILTNAVQAIKTEGIVKVCTKKKDDLVTITISDNGSGISKEHLRKIADPFFTTKDPGKGTGLGLSITYSIIKEHKGTIDFQSELGKGTKVIINLTTK